MGLGLGEVYAGLTQLLLLCSCGLALWKEKKKSTTR